MSHKTFSAGERLSLVKQGNRYLGVIIKEDFGNLLTNSLILSMLSESKRTVFASQITAESIVRQLKHLL